MFHARATRRRSRWSRWSDGLSDEHVGGPAARRPVADPAPRVARGGRGPACDVPPPAGPGAAGPDPSPVHPCWVKREHRLAGSVSRTDHQSRRRTMKAAALTIASLALVLAGAAGCGDDGGDGASGAPTDASATTSARTSPIVRRGVPGARRGLQDPAAMIKAIKGIADDMIETGTPEDISDDARRGLRAVRRRGRRHRRRRRRSTDLAEPRRATSAPTGAGTRGDGDRAASRRRCRLPSVRPDSPDIRPSSADR